MPRWVVYYHNSPSADCRDWGTRERGADRGEVADLDIIENRIIEWSYFDVLNTVHVESSGL